MGFLKVVCLLAFCLACFHGVSASYLSDANELKELEPPSLPNTTIQYYVELIRHDLEEQVGFSPYKFEAMLYRKQKDFGGGKLYIVKVKRDHESDFIHVKIVKINGMDMPQAINMLGYQKDKTMQDPIVNF